MNSQKESGISKQTLNRLPYYRGLLMEQKEKGVAFISSRAVAQMLGWSTAQVRKDLSAASNNGGKPKVGFNVEELIAGIERCLGYDRTSPAVLVGAGHLGKALLSYEGFEEHGVRITLAFDIDPELWMTKYKGKPIYDPKHLRRLCEKQGIRIGIIAVPASAAQSVCDQLVDAGIKAIWNFAPQHLVVPPDILIYNENMAASLAVLSARLRGQQTQK